MIPLFYPMIFLFLFIILYLYNKIKKLLFDTHYLPLLLSLSFFFIIWNGLITHHCPNRNVPYLDGGCCFFCFCAYGVMSRAKALTFLLGCLSNVAYAIVSHWDFIFPRSLFLLLPMVNIVDHLLKMTIGFVLFVFTVNAYYYQRSWINSSPF